MLHYVIDAFFTRMEGVLLSSFDFNDGTDNLLLTCL